MYSEIQKEPPLHHLLLSWLPWATRKPSTNIQVSSIASAGMAAQFHGALAQQIATSLRLQGVLPEDDTMLGSLEALALAGEISLPDFVGRVQNLFPRAMESLDLTLRTKIASLVFSA